jgi:CBS domain containing-hemolysin-like protein
MEFPEGDYESVGGFVIHALGKIPKSGDRLAFQGLDMIIESADDRKIYMVRIHRKQ